MTQKEKAKEKAIELIKSFQEIEVSAFYVDSDNDICIASDKMFLKTAVMCSLLVVKHSMEEAREYCDLNHHRFRMYFWSDVKRELEAMQ